MPAHASRGSAQPDSTLAAFGVSGSGQVDADAVWAVITGLYAAHGAGEQGQVDEQLDPAATMWHSESETMLAGKQDLDRLRAERADSQGEPEVSSYEAYAPVIDVCGHMALVRYWLRVDYAPADDDTPLRPELVRNTAVLRRSATDWRIVHLHEEVWAAGGVPEEA
ncbi:nuclear transport factor 2 family protein [Streptomyces sp. NPDC050485]|uniref:nuclear transport factor 2 family protein n=1 Tax=Streptomyces sp. NPDC050485 TaxID=3365617 RepID=UPI0037B96384